MKKQKIYPPIKAEPVHCFNDIDQSLTYSYAHYLNWLFDDRVELVKGKVFKMSPAPSRAHQDVSFSISLNLGNFLTGKKCRAYVAPFDVRFYKESKADQDVYTVLQPDICVICDQSKLDDRGCIGAPDLVVEILSPGSTKKELLHKYKVYEEFGVKEYWVVSCSKHTVLKYTLDETGGFSASHVYAKHEEMPSSVLPGFVLNLKAIFEY